ncbi:MAG: NYN domain-containing protein, partial [Trueperaceae bacterium]|nr:NYN domain-containing protein [Trueperaceae bacterium]
MSGAASGALTPQPGERPSQRVALFVDTQNLYYAARDGFDRFVDYARLLEVATRGRALHAATAYVVEREGETAAYGFITRLSALGFRVKRRKVRVHRADDQGRVVLEGDWDMGIAADLVRSWDHCDVIALASGDGDFVPLLELAQERGKRVEVRVADNGRGMTEDVMRRVFEPFYTTKGVGGGLGLGLAMV